MTDVLDQGYVDLYSKEVVNMSASLYLLDNERKEVTNKLVIKLLSMISNERRRKMIEMRFGLNGEYEHNFREIGERFGVTRQFAHLCVKQTLRDLKVFYSDLPIDF